MQIEGLLTAKNVARSNCSRFVRMCPIENSAADRWRNDFSNVLRRSIDSAVDRRPFLAPVSDLAGLILPCRHLRTLVFGEAGSRQGLSLDEFT